MKIDHSPAALRAAAGATASCRGRGGGGLRRRSWTRLCRAVAAGLLLALATAIGSAQPPQLLFSNQQKEEALRALPLDQLNEAARAKLTSVVSRPTIYRHMPTQVVNCDPDLHTFLVRYPEVVVNIWQLMGVTKVKVTRTGPLTFDAADGAGTVCRTELVYATPAVHVYYADGYYDGPLLQKPVTGECVLLLRSSYSTQGGRPLVTNTLDVFARLDHLGVEILVKTFYPAVGKTVDFNFSESIRFVGQVSQAAEANGPGMQRVAANLQNVQAEVRESFSQHVNLAYQRAVLRQADPALPLASAISDRRGQAGAGGADDNETLSATETMTPDDEPADPDESPGTPASRRKLLLRR